MRQQYRWTATTVSLQLRSHLSSEQASKILQDPDPRVSLRALADAGPDITGATIRETTTIRLTNKPEPITDDGGMGYPVPVPVR